MKYLEWVMAIGLCFTFPIAFIPTTMQQYVLFIPAFIALYLMVFLFMKKEIKLPILSLNFLIIFVFLITGFKFGINIDDIISLAGILLIPLIVQLYIPRDPISLLNKITIVFTVFEIILIGYIVSKGGYFNHRFSIEVRNTFSYAFPNYIGMFSAVKVGLVSYLYSVENISKKNKNLMMIIGILATSLSMSRTAFGMLVLIIGLPLFLKNRGSKKRNRKKRIRDLSLLIILLPIIIYSLNAKSEASSHATVEYTINERFGIWESIGHTIKENSVLGIGFRSVSDYTSRFDYSSTHNDYVDILIKGGVIMFVVIYGFFIKRIFILFKKKEAILVSIALAILMGGVTQNPLKFLPTITVFSAILAKSYDCELNRNEKFLLIDNKKRKLLRLT